MTQPISGLKLASRNKWISEGLILCFAEQKTSRERTQEHIIKSVIKTKYKSKQKLRSDRFPISLELITAQNKGTRGFLMYLKAQTHRLDVMYSSACVQNHFHFVTATVHMTKPH